MGTKQTPTPHPEIKRPAPTRRYSAKSQIATFSGTCPRSTSLSCHDMNATKKGVTNLPIMGRRSVTVRHADRCFGIRASPALGGSGE